MATPQKTTASTADVDAQLKEIRSDISKLTELLGGLAGDKIDATKSAARDEAEHLLKRAREMTDSAQGQAQDVTESVETYIKEKPFQSTLIALAVGLILGAMTRR